VLGGPPTRRPSLLHRGGLAVLLRVAVVSPGSSGQHGARRLATRVYRQRRRSLKLTLSGLARQGGARSRARAVVRRGEVWWAEHPDWGRRPALVMTREEAIDSLNEVFVVLATTRIRGIPTEVELGHEDGMPRGCVLNADHTDTVAKGYLVERITALSPQKVAAVCNALSAATGCALSARIGA